MHFSQVVINNESILSKESEGFIGRFRNSMLNVVLGFGEFLSHVSLDNLQEEVIAKLTDATHLLGRMGYPHIAVLMRIEKYNKNLKESVLKERLKGLITTSARLYQAMDVAYAIDILNNRNRSYQSEIQSIISICEFSSATSVSSWLHALYYLGQKQDFKETSKQKLYKMLDSVYADNDYTEGDANHLSDVRHGASQLAGVLAKLWGNAETTDKWRALVDADEFNEVSTAFEKGARFME